MITTQFCASCGAANEPGTKDCFACGNALISGEDTQEGTLLLERYQILAILGAGGFSSVFLARDLPGSQVVAIKQINLSGLSAEEAIDATNTFNREVNILSGLSHPQVPQIYDHFQDREHWYLVLEYLEGPTLETYLETRRTQDRPIFLAEALAIGLQLCTVLEHLHTRQPPIIFRDLKPGNLIRNPNGKLSLIDFGIARRFRPGQSRDTQLLGSPGYAAPEQYGRAQTSAQSDIYSLGALLYALLSGVDPAEQTPDLKRLDLTDQPGGTKLLELLQSMLALDPTTRPENVREVASRLTALKQHENAVQNSQRIWIPPIPQDYDTAGKGQQLQIQLPIQPGQSNAPTPKRGWITRRRALIGLGTLAAAGAGLYAWEFSTANAAITYRGHSDVVKSLAWGSDSQSILSGFWDETVQLWNVNHASGKAISQANLNGRVNALAWEPDNGPYIAVSSSSTGLVTILSAVQLFTAYAYAKSSQVNALAWSPDGQYLASASHDGKVLIVDAQTNATVFVYSAHTSSVNTVAWSPDGQLIASGDSTGTVHIWSPYGRVKAFINDVHSQLVMAVAWSPDGQYIASASSDTTVQVWNPDDAANLSMYIGHKDVVNALAWSPDGNRLVSVSDDATAQVWQARDGSPLQTYKGHSGSVQTVGWSPDGHFIASGSVDKTVQIWQPS